MLTPRKPGISLAPEVTEIVWSPVPEFALFLNGISVVVPPIEHLLNATMHEIRTNHCADNPALKQELDLFIKQETNHTIYHNRFNKLLLDAGYDIRPIMATVTAELKAMREKRSLAFVAAYCAGFENTATFSARYTYENCEEFLQGANPAGSNLWLWHIAEEFEHRTSCHEAFHAVSGNYFVRLYGFAYSFWHVNHCFARAAAILLNKYRESMTLEQRRASIRREKRLARRQLFYVIPRMLPLLLPGFNPGKLPIPPRIQAALEFFKNTGPITTGFVTREAAAYPP